MSGRFLAPVGLGLSSITSEVVAYNFTAMSRPLVVFDTPGLSDTRGHDHLGDEQIKDQIEIAMLKMSELTKNQVNAFLIFESCEEKTIRINMTLRALKDMFGSEYPLSSICMLSGCSENTFKIQKRKDDLINICLENGIDFMIWDMAENIEKY